MSLHPRGEALWALPFAEFTEVLRNIKKRVLSSLRKTRTGFQGSSPSKSGLCEQWSSTGQPGQPRPTEAGPGGPLPLPENRALSIKLQ